MFQLQEVRVNSFNELWLSVLQCLCYESFFFEFRKSLCHLHQNSLALQRFRQQMSADEKHSGGGNIAFNFKVSMLASDKGISLLTLLMVSVVMGLVFAIDGSQISKDILNGVCCRTIYIG